ncbi:MAG: pyruvate kinase [Chloroflexota bacterium]
MTSQASATTPRRAKIMATLGPASQQEDVIHQLLAVGVDIVRLNLAHGDHAQHRQTIERVRAVARVLDRHVPVIADLVGPRYRLASLPAPRVLKPGALVIISEGEDSELPLTRAGLVQRLNVGERLLIDNGAVELSIERSDGERAEARVIRGGAIGTGKGINLPETQLAFEISARDRADIAFCVDAGVDLIGASYVGSADDLRLLRRQIASAGADVPVISKIERAAAAEHVAAIVAASDAVMVARGDLGVELPLDEVPPLQKRILDIGRAGGTPVIVATDMLASMIREPRPTRAEVSDVANAVFDGADVLMLSGETAIGRYPVEAVRMMARIILRAEQTDGGRARVAPIAPPPGTSDVPNAVAAAAVRAAELLELRHIVAFTQTGSTAQLVARYRPAIPILAFTPDAAVARRVQLLWGVEPLVVPPIRHEEDVIEQVERDLLHSGRARPGEVVIVLMSAPLGERAPTNLLRVHRLHA